MSSEIVITPGTIANLTVGEIEIIEDRTGRAIGQLFDADAKKGVTLHALAYVVMRREAKDSGQPIPTWEDAEDVRVSLAEDVEVSTSEKHPTAPGRRPRRAG